MVEALIAHPAIRRVNFGGPISVHLEYEIQGATPRSMPDVVRRLVAAGVHPPSRFGAAERAAYFPDDEWRVLACGPATMYGVALTEGGDTQAIPGYYAVLAPKPVPDLR